MRNRLTLQHLKQHPEKKFRFSGHTVLIWSGQWKLWWRPNAQGYTDDIHQAGRFTFDQAWACSSHCGPEKKIRYHILIAA